MNEITSAMTIFALAPYINAGLLPGSESIGTNGANASNLTPQAAIGLNNAFSTIQNLTNVSLGTAITSNSYPGANASVTGVTVTATPETSEIVTIANILASCINQATATSPRTAVILFAAAPGLRLDNQWVYANLRYRAGNHSATYNVAEIVGAAVPTATPLSVAAANGTLATKPRPACRTPRTSTWSTADAHHSVPHFSLYP